MKLEENGISKLAQMSILGSTTAPYQSLLADSCTIPGILINLDLY